MSNRSLYVSAPCDECPTCGYRYMASLGYEDEVETERRAVECACGSMTFCQGCEADETGCAHDGCRVVFCSEECASGHDLDGDIFCAAHLPLPEVQEKIERFPVAAERFLIAAHAVR